LDSAFVDELKMRLCSDEKWDIKSEVKLPNMPSIWSKFDIGCYYDNELIGLIELSVKDTNVAHALHNGEVKLLGICQGVSVSNSKQTLASYRESEDDVISNILTVVTKIPVRGLFYTNGDGLYKKRETKMLSY